MKPRVPIRRRIEKKLSIKPQVDLAQYRISVVILESLEREFVS